MHVYQYYKYGCYDDTSNMEVFSEVTYRQVDEHDISELDSDQIDSLLSTYGILKTSMYDEL